MPNCTRQFVDDRGVQECRHGSRNGPSDETTSQRETRFDCQERQTPMMQQTYFRLSIVLVVISSHAAHAEVGRCPRAWKNSPARRERASACGRFGPVHSSGQATRFLKACSGVLQVPPAFQLLETIRPIFRSNRCASRKAKAMPSTCSGLMKPGPGGMTSFRCLTPRSKMSTPPSPLARNASSSLRIVE